MYLLVNFTTSLAIPMSTVVGQSIFGKSTFSWRNCAEPSAQKVSISKSCKVLLKRGNLLAVLSLIEVRFGPCTVRKERSGG